MSTVADNVYILTGTMGSGKSTVIEEFRKQGITTISEPARDILNEQRVANRNGSPEKDPELFTKLLFHRTLSQYSKCQKSESIVISDRGLPDIIGYARLFGLDQLLFIHAAKENKYNKKVFILPCWDEIYVNDDERKMSLQQAQAFSRDLYEIYQSMGYQLIEVPKSSPSERANFILSNILG
tara:strand:- start:62 stop:607 length:546 start_codon:yes stop_codon:yes gene_type:complete